MNVAKALNIRARSRCRLEVHNWRTGKVELQTPWIRNLMLDQGLNGLARSATNSIATFPSNCFVNARIGDSNSANEIASGAITFTQSGTTLTASAGFFTAAMVGGLFKWGSGSSGNERYISGYTSATEVTLDTSETVGTPDTGSVWMVQRTALVNQIAVSTGYDATPGNNGVTIVGNVATLQRVFVFAAPAVPQNVNEIGFYKDNSTARVYGRIVLPSTVVVGTSNFLQLTIQLELTYSPGAPTAVSNVGTNIDTAGDAMLEVLSATQTAVDQAVIAGILASGFSANAYGCFDGSAVNTRLKLATQTYTQRTATNTGTIPSYTRLGALTNSGWTYVSGSVGVMRVNAIGLTIACSGQTCYGLVWGIHPSTGADGDYFDIKLTTPFVLPTGNFTYDYDFRCRYGRTLTNS